MFFFSFQNNRHPCSFTSQFSSVNALKWRCGVYITNKSTFYGNFVPVNALQLFFFAVVVNAVVVANACSNNSSKQQLVFICWKPKTLLRCRLFATPVTSELTFFLSTTTVRPPVAFVPCQPTPTEQIVSGEQFWQRLLTIDDGVPPLLYLVVVDEGRRTKFHFMILR